MAQVTITVSPEGEVEVKAAGVAGTSCKALTAAIEKSIGKTTGDKPTSEMHAKTAQVAKAGA